MPDCHATIVTRCYSMANFGVCPYCGYSAAGEPFGVCPCRSYNAAAGSPFGACPYHAFTHGRAADYFTILLLILLLTLEPPPC